MRQRIHVDKPKAVIQVFKNVVRVNKPDWRSGRWHEQTQWQPELESYAGGVSDDIVVLNETVLDHQHDFLRSGLLLVNDSNTWRQTPPTPDTRSIFRNGWVDDGVLHLRDT